MTLQVKKIATWNVNSVRLRLPHFEKWFSEDKIDIILLQEIKCVKEAFPYDFFESYGYNCAVFGQKTFNGVAILSKSRIEDIQTNFPTLIDTQARYIEAFTDGIRVASVYVPNGQEVDSPHYAYKLNFMASLAERITYLRTLNERCLIGGDFNIAPRPQDIYQERTSEIFVSQPEREAFRKLLNIGFFDAYDMLHQNAGYTWWDYRGGSFEKNLGMRIDHMLISPQLADELEQVGPVVELRKQEKPSDHVPVVCEVKYEIN